MKYKDSKSVQLYAKHQERTDNYQDYNWYGIDSRKVRREKELAITKFGLKYVRDKVWWSSLTQKDKYNVYRYYDDGNIEFLKEKFPGDIVKRRCGTIAEILK